MYGCISHTCVRQFEIREALALEKRVVLVHETDPRHSPYDFAAESAQAPEDLRSLVENHESLPFRRRGYERDAMLHALITRAGYKERFELAKYAVTQTVMPPHGAPSTGSPNKAKRIAGARGIALRRFSVDDGRTRLFLARFVGRGAGQVRGKLD